MSIVTASAPGKVVISGEYAVLDGAPAVAAAVTPRAQVSVRRANAQNHTVMSQRYSDVCGEFRSQDDSFEWLRGGDTYGIVEHAWRATGIAPGDSVAIDINTSEFFDRTGKTKLGLGSSAALMTSLTAAMLAFAGEETDVSATALAGHRSLQRGAGSGVDIACSAHGGLLLYRVVDLQPMPLAFPDDLEYAFFWSGVPANTTAKLKTLSQQAPKPSRVALDEAAVRTAATWSGGTAADIVAAMHAYTEMLRRFSIDHDLGIFDAGHAGLVTAMDDAVVYKPCGAGGGDIGMALASSADAMAAFVERASTTNFVRLDLRIEPHGYQVAREDD